MRHHASGLAAEGITVATFEFPYMASGRRLPDRAPTLLEAFRAAVQSATARLAPAPTRVILAGKSMGGRMATMLATEVAVWPADIRVVGVVAFGYPLRPPSARTPRMAPATAGTPPRRPGGDRVSHLTRLAVPVLMVQGTRDPFGGPDDLHAVTADAPLVEVLGVEGGDHGLVVPRRSVRTQSDVDRGIWHTVGHWIARCP